MIRVVVSTSDKYLWALKPFSYLFNTYWSSLQPVIVAGFSPPSFSLPSNFEFHSIDSRNYPAAEWTNGLAKFFNWFTDDHFIFMLEDFWLRRTANLAAIASLHEYAQIHPEVLRIDLGTDRLHTHDPRYVPDYEHWGSLDLIKSQLDWPYTFSTQASIWKREKFIQFLKPNWSPWQFELQGGEVLVKEYPEYVVLGTRQIPLAYKHAVVSGASHPDLEGIDHHHVQYMTEQGWIP
jgi:hypothetical protein